MLPLVGFPPRNIVWATVLVLDVFINVHYARVVSSGTEQRNNAVELSYGTGVTSLKGGGTDSWFGAGLNSSKGQDCGRGTFEKHRGKQFL